MTIHTALRKITSLSKEELLHCIQRIDNEIDYYKIVTKNYDEYNMKRFGIPYFNMLNDQKRKFKEQYDRQTKS